MAALDAFLAAVGGANVGAIYDPSYNAPTTSSGRITVLSDARGSSGFGPSLTPGGGTSGPLWPSGTPAAMNFDSGGGSRSLTSATASQFDLSGPCTQFAFLSSSTAGVAYAWGTGTDRKMTPRISATKEILHYDDTSGTLDSLIALSGASQIVTLSKGATTNRKVKIDANAEQSGTLSSASAGSRALTLGDHMPNSAPLTCLMYAWGSLSYQALSADHTAIAAYYSALLGLATATTVVRERQLSAPAVMRAASW